MLEDGASPYPKSSDSPYLLGKLPIRDAGIMQIRVATWPAASRKNFEPTYSGM